MIIESLMVGESEPGSSSPEAKQQDFVEEDFFDQEFTGGGFDWEESPAVGD